MSHAMNVSRELMNIPEMEAKDESFGGADKKMIQQFKKAILMTAGRSGAETECKPGK